MTRFFCVAFIVIPVFSNFCCLISLDIFKNSTDNYVYLYTEDRYAFNATEKCMQLELFQALLEREHHEKCTLVLQGESFSRQLEDGLDKNVFSQLVIQDPDFIKEYFEPLKAFRNHTFKDIFTQLKQHLSLLQGVWQVSDICMQDILQQIKTLKLVLKQYNLDTTTELDQANQYFATCTSYSDSNSDFFANPLQELRDSFLTLWLFGKITFQPAEKLIVITTVKQSSALKQLLLEGHYTLVDHYGSQHVHQPLPLKYIKCIKKKNSKKHHTSDCVLM